MSEKYDKFKKNDRRYKPEKENESQSGAVIGRNSVRELLRSGREIDKILVQKGERTGSITSLVAEALEKSIPVIECEKAKLDKISANGNHQGIAAFAAEKEYCSIDDILECAKSRGEKPFIVIADKIEDPHNLGAIIRSAECCGAHGVIIPKRNGVLLTQTVSKASAGAIEHMLVAKVTNLAAAVDELKEKGVWIYAVEAGGKYYYDEDFDTPAALILGSEANGVSRLLIEKSDFHVSIPMYGKVNSFNVSAAAAITLCEVAKQRHKEIQ